MWLNSRLHEEPYRCLVPRGVGSEGALAGAAWLSSCVSEMSGLSHNERACPRPAGDAGGDSAAGVNRRKVRDVGSPHGVWGCRLMGMDAIPVEQSRNRAPVQLSCRLHETGIANVVSMQMCFR